MKFRNSLPGLEITGASRRSNSDRPREQIQNHGRSMVGSQRRRLDRDCFDHGPAESRFLYPEMVEALLAGIEEHH